MKKAKTYLQMMQDAGFSKFEVITSTSTLYFDCKDKAAAEKSAARHINSLKRAGQNQDLISVTFISKY